MRRHSERVRIKGGSPKTSEKVPSRKEGKEYNACIELIRIFSISHRRTGRKDPYRPERLRLTRFVCGKTPTYN